MKLNKILTTLIIITLNMLCYSQFSGGSGTTADPFQIATAEDLNNIRYYLTSSFIQTADIDLGVAPWHEGEGWDPIGDYDWSNPNLSFRGNYNGNEYKILNMYINRPSESYLGLYGSTEGCILKNIRILDFTIITQGNQLGGITGISYNDLIIYCDTEGYIEGYSDMGLLAGSFEGYKIDNCHTKGEMIGTADRIGGLIGFCVSDTVMNCTSEVKISGYSNSDFIGGLLAFCVDSEYIENCSANCNIISEGSWIGGLIGYYLESSLISLQLYNCFSNGIINSSLSTSNKIGGFIGQVSGYDSICILINNCFSSVDVTGNDMVSGYIGRIYESVDVLNCYSTGQVNGNTNVGGFLGSVEYPENVTVTNSYWDMETSGIDSSAAGEGRTTAEMTLPYSGNTYVGWDFINVWRDDTSNQNNGYPTFLWVSGIEEDEDSVIPETSRLYKNYPNPFNPVTQIKFDLAKTGNVKLSVYNINGQKVAELLNGVQNAGIHTIEFDGSNLNSGVYYYTLETAGIRQTNKMILTK